MRASRNPPSVLGEIPLSSQPEQVQDPYALFGLAPPGSAVSFQYGKPQAFAIIVLECPTGSLFCSVASRLRLIVANSSACSEGGVSSHLSHSPTGSQFSLVTLAILCLENIRVLPLLAAPESRHWNNLQEDPYSIPEKYDPT
jgi:hypothetical protein